MLWRFSALSSKGLKAFFVMGTFDGFIFLYCKKGLIKKKIDTQPNSKVETKMEELAELIQNGQAKRIIVLCGAGISTGTS
jgi:hypothetical protein